MTGRSPFKLLRQANFKLSPRTAFRLGVWFLVASMGLIFIIDFISTIVVESLWFAELGYSDVFFLRLRIRGILGAVVLITSGGFLLGNLWLTQRLQHDALATPNERRHTWFGSLGFRPLLLTVGGLGLALAILLYHYSTLMLTAWQTYPIQFIELPPIFELETIGQILQQWSQQSWWWLGVGGFILSLTIVPWFILTATSIGLTLSLAFVVAGQWAKVLAAFNSSDFGNVDPLFQLDISFYTFILPCWKLVQFWGFGLSLYTLMTVALLYFVSGNSLADGKFAGFSLPQQRHLWGLGGGFLLNTSYSYWLARYEQLYSLRGVTYGASYTDVNVQLPVNTILSLLALLLALGCLIRMTIPFTQRSLTRWKILRKLKPIGWTSNELLLTVLIFYVGLSLVMGRGVPTLVQRLVVQPNELARERPYIKRSIAASREAFGLNNIDVTTFDPGGELTAADLLANQATLQNIRLWDSRPLLQTNRQLQQIRLYYSFPDADIDRYTLKEPNGPAELQQVLLAARELDYSGVPNEAQTWVNEHLVYTHGYGFTLSPVNTAGVGGLPDYFVKDIGTAASGSSTLDITNEAVRYSIPIDQPRIYYGALTNTYIMTQTRVQELDYPSGNENIYNIYDGRGGISLGSTWRRLLFAVYLRDWQMLLTRNFLPETRLLFRREIKERVRTIAPFLHYDPDSYLVIANPNLEVIGDQVVDTFISAQPTEPSSYLYWILDAYTTSDFYPYSDPGEHSFNYIRNSVKVVIDAYHGSVDFYVAEPNDPLIQTWNKVFPNMFKPLYDMPIALATHIRYPSRLFKIQSERLLTYHMTDPQVFYNREDQWQTPTEIYGDEVQPIESYYLITRLPTEEAEEFVLLNPFTPVSRNNLVAWLAGRSDDENYGKLLLYQFPKQRLIFGPEQIEARINQDPVISQQISLWDRQGSRAVQGNLLVIPIEQSLLYVEPIYLEAEQNSLPTLARVIIVYRNRIVMAETLEKALETLFAPDSQVTNQSEAAVPILRPIEETIPNEGLDQVLDE